MTVHTQLTGTCIAMAALLVTPALQAAYPTNMKVEVEVWNDTQQALQLTHATWSSQTSELEQHDIPAEQRQKTFQVTLANPRNDGAAFRYIAANGKVCDFLFAHKKTFSLFGISPAPEKSVSSRSAGVVPAQCSASVTKGNNSMSGYSVRFTMK